MNHLVVCCDGTWNTPDQTTDGVPTPTNVVRFHHAVSEKSPRGALQLKYYHTGVGVSENLGARLAGGAFGVGLDRNIMSAYCWLCKHYSPGDRLFLFGFSRGAYTVRCLAGIVTTVGLLDLQKVGSEAQAWERVETTYHAARWSKTSEIPVEWPRHHGDDGAPCDTVDFLGVWDTVGSLGIPDELPLLSLLDAGKDRRFPDVRLSDKVLQARHAVAIDEMRSSFSPTLWTDLGTRDPESVKQVWFPGCHGDVGGGFKETGLSDGALLWMIQEAQGLGLGFEKAVVSQLQPRPLDVVHSAEHPLYQMIGTQPRSIPLLSNGVQVHSSVDQRRKTPSISQGPYRPSHDLAQGDSHTCKVYAGERWNETGVYLRADATYTLEAWGEWMDWNLKWGPEGAPSGTPGVGALAYLPANLLGKVENLFKRLSRNEQADFWFTRRHERLPWFSLVGVVANGEGPKPNGTAPVHEHFGIGRGCTVGPQGSVTLRKSGYLSCYANDCWDLYANNRGSVHLTVRRIC